MNLVRDLSTDVLGKTQFSEAFRCGANRRCQTNHRYHWAQMRHFAPARSVKVAPEIHLGENAGVRPAKKYIKP